LVWSCILKHTHTGDSPLQDSNPAYPGLSSNPKWEPLPWLSPFGVHLRGQVLSASATRWGCLPAYPGLSSNPFRQPLPSTPGGIPAWCKSSCLGYQVGRSVQFRRPDDGLGDLSTPLHKNYNYLDKMFLLPCFVRFSRHACRIKRGTLGPFIRHGTFIPINRKLRPAHRFVTSIHSSGG
jgi:hypothetical protein